MSGQVLYARSAIEPNAKTKRSGLADMHPNYFAMVMATGIVGIGAHLDHVSFLADAFLYASILFFAVISALTLVRLFRFPAAMKDDLLDHSRSMSYLTTVAALCVLGNQIVMQTGTYSVGICALVGAFVLWCALSYAILTCLSLKRDKPALQEGLGGSWLLIVVSTESLSVLGCSLSSALPQYQAPLLLGCVCLWLLGAAIYSWIIALIFLRYTFFPMQAAKIKPSHWIDMGSMATATLAGAQLLNVIANAPLFASLHGFVFGMTCAFWAVATWWWPVAAVLSFAHLVSCNMKLQYKPSYWSIVFPLGMYGVCTQQFAEAAHFGFLQNIAQGMFWTALAAWVAVFISFCISRGGSTFVRT